MCLADKSFGSWSKRANTHHLTLPDPHPPDGTLTNGWLEYLRECE